MIVRHSSRLIFILIYILTVTLVVYCQDISYDEDEDYFKNTLNPDEIIDPHSFYYDKQSKKMIREAEVDRSTNFVQENKAIEEGVRTSKQAENLSTHEGVFYKRLINLLLTNIHIQDKDEISITGILEIELSHSQMEILQNFHVHKTSLREVDEILSNVIKKPRYNYMHGVTYIFETLERALSMILKTVQKHQDATIIVFSILMVCLSFRMISWGQRLPLFSIIQVIFILSFFMNWWHLIQEAEIKYTTAQMKYTQVPISCQPDKMTMWDKVASFFTKDDCEQYYRTMMANPKLKVTPAFALSHFITTVILHPITHMGTTISEFIHNATDNLPWTYGWIIKCILFLCIGFVIITIPFCLSGASFNVGLGPLLKLGISYDKQNEKGNSIKSIEKREPVQVILQLPQGTNVPQVENTSKIEQSNALQVAKCDNENITPTDNDSEECCNNQPCGDTIKNTKLSKDNDERNEKYKKVDTVKLEKHGGSGDG